MIPNSRRNEDKFVDLKLTDNGIPDLSIISEENSHIPTDLCTSADEMKSDYEQDNSTAEQENSLLDVTISQVWLQSRKKCYFFCLVFS